MENDKMRFQATTQMSHQKIWRSHLVQSLPFLLDDIQMEKMKLQKNSFFCSGKAGNLHIVSTFLLDAKIRQCARILKANFLLGKLGAGDMVVLDAMYHAKGLNTLYNKANQQRYGRDYDDIEKHLQGILLAESASFMEQTGIVKCSNLQNSKRCIEIG